jgi:hypothetical protein
MKSHHWQICFVSIMALTGILMGIGVISDRGPASLIALAALLFCGWKIGRSDSKERT